MPTYRDWIREIDIKIDYYSAFIKAWIAFNAWYRNDTPHGTDRTVIENLKNSSNRFKGYIETMLDSHNTSADSLAFKDNLSKLQVALTNAAITTQERGGVNQQISFSEIAITNPKTCSNEDYRTTHYRIERIGSKIKTLIHKKGDPATIYFQFEQESYNVDELDGHHDFLALGNERQAQCKAFYKLICPYTSESVLTKDADNNVIFISERSKVSRGIIEVLYLLRCSLMHGEVTPDNNSSEVYKYAYAILSAILKQLV